MLYHAQKGRRRRYTALVRFKFGELHLLYIVDTPAPGTAGRQEEASQQADLYRKAVAKQLENQIPVSLGVSITWSVAVDADVTRAILKHAEPPVELAVGEAAMPLPWRPMGAVACGGW